MGMAKEKEKEKEAMKPKPKRGFSYPCTTYISRAESQSITFARNAYYDRVTKTWTQGGPAVRKIEFTNGVFMTDDPELQFLIENCSLFKEGRIQRLEQTDVEVVEEEVEVKAKVKVEAEAEEEESPARTVVIKSEPIKRKRVKMRRGAIAISEISSQAEAEAETEAES